MSRRTVDVSLRVARPRKSRAKPIRKFPKLRYLPFLKEMHRKAKNIIGTAITPRLKLLPLKERAKIQAVSVVPMLAPIITPIAFARLRSPAFTKLTSIRVVAVED